MAEYNRQPVKAEDWKHPEVKDDEVFYCNLYSQGDFNKMSFKQKRLGNQAYSDLGSEIPKSKGGDWPKPVFVSSIEFEEREGKK